MIRPIVFIFSFLISLTNVFAQNPAGYGNVSSWSNFATFSLKGTDRIVKQEKGITFDVEKEVLLTFQVLVLPDGKVRYVRPPKCLPELSEYRLGGTHALYNFEFEPIEATKGNEWLTVEMRILPDPVNPQAQ